MTWTPNFLDPRCGLLRPSAMFADAVAAAEIWP
jgi:hypothetical protein